MLWYAIDPVTYVDSKDKWINRQIKYLETYIIHLIMVLKTELNGLLVVKYYVVKVWLKIINT